MRLRRAVLAAGALGALVGVMVTRAAQLRSHQLTVEPAAPIAVAAGAPERLAAALRIATVSLQDRAQIDPAPFFALHRLLAESFPAAHRVLEREVVNERSLLYRWPGRDGALAPDLFMAHLDVVPVEPNRAWTHAPFAGEIADGFVWGRGALDDKGSLMALFEAVESLAAAGWQPARTLYIALGQDEEIGGAEGNVRIAARLAERGVHLEAVFDEGTPITTGIVEGVAAPVAGVAVSEKGYLTLELTVAAAGGHSSMPPPATAVGILAAAIARLETHPFPPRLDGATRRMLETLAPEMPFGRRLALANLWLLGPLIARQLTRTNAGNALVRTTLAPTMLEGSQKENVLPLRARGVVNLRILPGEDVAGTIALVRSVIADERVKIATVPPTLSEPARLSSDGSRAWRVLSRTLRQRLPGVLVTPALMVGASDSRHYLAIADDVYRFLPFVLTREDLQRPHGTDERVRVEDYLRAIQVYTQLVRDAAAP
jgi:carboxypeptidase PM20D1